MLLRIHAVSTLQSSTLPVLLQTLITDLRPFILRRALIVLPLALRALLAEQVLAHAHGHTNFWHQRRLNWDTAMVSEAGLISWQIRH